MTPELDDTVAASPGESGGGEFRVRAGDRIAHRFVAERVLGEGTFGVVWQAHDDTGQQVALKILRPEVAHTVERVKRREMEVLRRVHGEGHNPHVVRVLTDEPLSHGALTVIPFELIAGQSLKDVLSRERVLDVHEARRIAVELARGLAAIHKAEGVHRDIKPDNIRLRVDGTVVILDLGIAKALWETNTMTAAGQAPMTPLYAAPEQLCGEEVGPSTDVYSLGLVLHELLTGAVPLGGRSLPELIVARTTGHPPDPRSARAATPADLADLVRRCLERSSKDRPSAQEVAESLELALAATARESRAVTSPVTASNRPSNVRRWYWIAAGITSVIILGGGVQLVLNALGERAEAGRDHRPTASADAASAAPPTAEASARERLADGPSASKAQVSQSSETAPPSRAPLTSKTATTSATKATCGAGMAPQKGGQCCPIGMVWLGKGCRRPLAN